MNIKRVLPSFGYRPYVRMKFVGPVHSNSPYNSPHEQDNNETRFDTNRVYLTNVRELKGKKPGVELTFQNGTVSQLFGITLDDYKNAVRCAEQAGCYFPKVGDQQEYEFGPYLNVSG